MKILKIILVIIAILAVIFFGVALFLPKTYNVTRTIIINAPDSIVYENTSNFNKFLKWNPWYKMEPSAKVEISGPVSQPGHLYTWTGKETGQGQMLIKDVEPLKMVDIELKFLKPFESTADTKFLFESANEATKVSWIMTGENKSAMEKWMGLCMDGMIGGDFESGLNNLKTLSEKK